MERKEERSPLCETVALTWAGCHWGLGSRSYNRGKVGMRRNKKIKKYSSVPRSYNRGNIGMKRNKLKEFSRGICE